MMHSTVNRKMEIITDILENETYMPSSGVYKQLVIALNRLSISDLDNLRLIVKLRDNQENK